MAIGVADVEQACFECGQWCTSRRSLGNHVARSHKELGGLHGYALKHLLSGSTPLCGCGCGEPVAWHKLLYRFNDYVNGHNPSSLATFKPTPAQVAHRNSRIKQAYVEKGTSIKEAISARVREAAAKRKSEGFDFSGFFITKWQDPNFQSAQRAARLASWSGVEGDERRARVFTPEFGRKISAANMRRDAKRTSREESVFVERLRSAFPGTERSKWFNFSERAWCADAWIPSLGAIVEVDGTYWHGLDRDSDFTLEQITNLTNDVRKNALARSCGLTLLRFAGSVDPTPARSLGDLVQLSHHAVVEGLVTKEGTFRVDEHRPVVSRNTLLSTDKAYREQRLLPALCDLLKAHVGYHGWFYPPSSGTLQVSLDALRAAKVGLMREVKSSTWLKSFSRAFWDVDDGPVRSFERSLDKVLRYRLGLNASKPYTYTVSDGSRVTATETFDINLSTIRRGYVVQRNAVSWFQPAAAFQLYRRHLASIEAPVVWDPSVGFSARLLGFAAAYPRGTYVGTDPASAMHRDAVRLKDELNKVEPDLRVSLHNVGSEHFVPDPGTLDMVMTSPPYFDRERYVDEPGQCWRDHPTRGVWTERYLLPTLQNARNGLRTGGKLVINVNDDLVSDTVAAARAAGLVFTGADALVLKADHFARKRGSVSRSEPILVFTKTR